MCNFVKGKVYKKEQHQIIYNGTNQICTFPIPTRCIYCNIPANYQVIYISEQSSLLDDYFCLLLECQNCGLHRVISYKIQEATSQFKVNTYYMGMPEIKIPPLTVDVNFPDTIKNLSPNFIQTYTDSLLADKHGLDTLYGMGLRKSVEILVKDWIFLNNHDKNLSKPLSQLINTIDNTDIQALAKASTWLGNDFTHTERKHPNKTEQDLLRFIDVLVSYIHNQLTVIEAKRFINN